VREDSELADPVRQDHQLWTDPFRPWVESNDPLKRTVVSVVSAERQRARLPHSGSERNHLFLNRQGKTFLDASGVSGLNSPADGRAFAITDFDRDGLQDVVVVNSNAPWVSLYRNQLSEAGAEGNFIAVRFVGGNRSAKKSSRYSVRDGYGAKVQVQTGELSILREHRCGEGLAAQNSATMLIGIGAADYCESVIVTWPSGESQLAEDVPAGDVLTFYEEPTMAPNGEAVESEPYLPDRSAWSDDRLAKSRSEDKIPLSLQYPQLNGAHATTANEESFQATLRLFLTLATWCEACRREMPLIHELRDAFPVGSLAMYGVPVDPEDETAALEQMVEELQAPYELLTNLDAEEIDEFNDFVAEELHQQVVPVSVVTDAIGTVLYVTAGLPTVSDLRRLAAEAQAAP